MTDVTDLINQLREARNNRGAFVLQGPAYLMRLCDEAATALERGVWKPPEGWVLVPCEPTDEMIACAGKASSPGFSIMWRNIAAEVYRAMIAATPPLQAKDKTDD